MTVGTSTLERRPKPRLPPYVGLPDLPAIRESRGRPKWGAWDYTWNERREMWDKPTISARNGGAGSSTDQATEMEYAHAADFSKVRRMTGVGYVLPPKDEESGIDPDDCRDPETGTLQA